MKPGTLVRWLCALAALFMAGAASAADVHVMISAGFSRVSSQLGPAFERTSGHRLVTTRGPIDGRLAGGNSCPARARRDSRMS